MQRKAPASEVKRLQEVLDPEAFTIGFARRFATYKRATLLFRDLPRLKRILTNPRMPVQIVIAGRLIRWMFPARSLIREIVQYSRDPELARAYRVRRRLRHPRGAGNGAERRRLAEHAAPRRRSLRDQRHESRHQRRAERKHSRRMVRRSGGGFRAAGRSAIASRIRRTATTRTRLGCIRCSKTKSCRSFTKAANRVYLWSGCAASKSRYDISA